MSSQTFAPVRNRNFPGSARLAGAALAILSLLFLNGPAPGAVCPDGDSSGTAGCQPEYGCREANELLVCECDVVAKSVYHFYMRYFQSCIVPGCNRLIMHVGLEGMKYKARDPGLTLSPDETEGTCFEPGSITVSCKKGAIDLCNRDEWPSATVAAHILVVDEPDPSTPDPDECDGFGWAGGELVIETHISPKPCKKQQPVVCDSNGGGAGQCPTCGLGQGGSVLRVGNAAVEVLATTNSTAGCYGGLLCHNTGTCGTTANGLLTGACDTSSYWPQVALGDYYVDPNNRDGWTAYWGFETEGQGENEQITKASLTAEDEDIDRIYYYELTGLSIGWEDAFPPERIPLRHVTDYGSPSRKTVCRYEYATYDELPYVTLQYDLSGNSIRYQYDQNYNNLTKLTAEAADESTRALEVYVDEYDNVTKVSSPCTSCGEQVYSYTTITQGSSYPEET